MPSGKSVLQFSLSGALDAETTAKFDAVLREVLSQPEPITLVRFANVHYVNSSGMGLLIKYSDLHQSRGGELVLVEISPKVLSMFRMLGLLSVLKTFPTPALALAALGAPKQDPALPAQDGAAGARFPYTMPCVSCDTRLSIQEAGYYKCPSCDTCYQIEAGQLPRHFLSELRIPFEASLSYDPGFIEGICGVATRAAERADPAGDREALIQAFRKLLERLVLRGKEAKGRTLRILIASEPGGLMIGIRTDVKSSDAAQGQEWKTLVTCADKHEVIDGTTGTFFKIMKNGAAPASLAKA